MGEPVAEGTGVDWQAVSAAVALLTRRAMRPPVSRAAVLDDLEPGDVLLAMETISDGLLDALAPAGREQLLKRLGLCAAVLASGEPQ